MGGDGLLKALAAAEANAADAAAAQPILDGFTRAIRRGPHGVELLLQIQAAPLQPCHELQQTVRCFAAGCSPDRLHATTVSSVVVSQRRLPHPGTYVTARLAGALGLDRLCEDLVSALAAAAGVPSPAPPGSAAEGKQVAALAALASLGTCPEAGLLGGGWVIILRVLSALEALQVCLSGAAQHCQDST